MSDPRGGARRTLLLAALFFSVGVGIAVYLHWPALADYEVYRSDIRQAPHWAAYHSSTFAEDDMLLEYSRYNESPVQNAIYYVGTYFVDMVDLTKLLAVLSYGMLAALFFWAGQSMYGTGAGVLAALFVAFLPDQWEFSAGFFSKYWMTPVILMGLFVLEKERWRLLVPLMLFASLAYPVSAVMLGAFAASYMIFRAIEDRAGALEILKFLSLGSVLALAVLLSKYLTPPDFIGQQLPGALLRQMPEMQASGLSGSYIPIPSVWSQIWELVGHPFVLGSGALYTVVLRKKLHWDTTWTALLVASVLCYVAADTFFMRLYIPNRYSRHAIAVILILWNARNLSAVLALVPKRAIRYAAAAMILTVGAYLYGDTFRQGEDTTNRTRFRDLSAFVRTLPPGVLIAGGPYLMDDIPVQARRSVLVNYKLTHPWWDQYYPEMRARTEATYEAIYATDFTAVNRLHEEYGVTHFVVSRSAYNPDAITRGRLYVDPFNRTINTLTNTDQPFVLNDPPAESVLWDGGAHVVIELPLGS
jgi:hypothetical protein